MTEAIEMLPKNDFFRVHKSYVINLNHVKKIERHQVWVGTEAVPIAANYRDDLMEILKKIWMVK
jgi:two-component system, LytTR family, response regulator